MGKRIGAEPQRERRAYPSNSALILSPVTTPCRIYCQGANYRQHMIESGMDPDAKAFNMFFTKSDASIASAKGTVTPPKHVSLLDYEVELAMIFRRPIVSAVTVTRENLQGLCLRRRHRKRLQRPRRAAAANAILQGQKLSRLLPDRPVADRARRGRIRRPRRPRAASHGQRRGPAAGFHAEPRFQAGRDDFRIVHLRQHRARRRVADRNAERLRPATSARPDSPGRPAFARTPVLEAVPECAAAQG